MILQKEFHVIYALAHVCGQDRTLLASLLLKIFRHEKAEAPLLRTLNDREINMEGNRRAHGAQHRCFLRLRLCTDKPLFPWHIQPDEATTLFRATTLASTLMEQYMKATATPFVHHALKDTILKIMESKQSCEVKGGWRKVHSQVSLWCIVPLKSSHSAVFGDLLHLD